MEEKLSPTGENAPRKMRAVRVPGAGRGGRIAGEVTRVISPIADEMGYMIWDVEYVKEGADYILRITIDSEEGITIDDCEKFTRAIDAPLDEADPIEAAYLLEVSSPGIERSLSRPEHFEYCIGEKVELKLFAPVDGVKLHTGILTAYGENGIVLTVGDAEKLFSLDSVAKARTVFDF